jgi:long-chain acyl-CoA synthetase
VTELCRLSLHYTPTATALIAGKERWTYGSLNDTGRSLATAMGREGLAGERVAMMLPNGRDAMLSYLACFASGAVAGPLNSRYAAPEAEHAVRRARPRWLVVHPSRLGMLGAIDPAALDGVRALVAGADAAPIGLGYAPLAPLLRGPGVDPLPAPGGRRLSSSSPPGPRGCRRAWYTATIRHWQSSPAHQRRSATCGRTTSCKSLVHVSGFIAALTTLLAGVTVAVYDGFDATAYVAALRLTGPR